MAILYNKETLLANKNLAAKLDSLYNRPVEQSAERMASLLNRHAAAYSGTIRLFSSPGRIEIVGNHTDHNNGKVICAAISVDTLAAVTARTDNRITVSSAGYPKVEIDLDNLSPVTAEKGKSDALIRGVAAGFAERGYKIGGFDATTTSDVFKGAGISSSASFEVLTAEIFNVLYNSGKVGKVEKAIISQYAENVYFGKPSGLMDQSAISLGGVSYIDFKNPKSPIVQELVWPFDDLEVIIVNCGGDHCNLTPQYSAIRNEMESVAALLGKEKLRFVEPTEFYTALPELSKKISGRALLRAIHYFDENERVESFKKGIITKDETAVLNAVTASGLSSYKLLQNCYAEGDHSQTIPLALLLSERTQAVKAVRVHGGGFAGTILAFAERGNSAKYIAEMSSFYGAANVFALKIRDTGAEEIIF